MEELRFLEDLIEKELSLLQKNLTQEICLQGALVATAVGTLAIILYMFFIYGWRKAVVTTLTMIFYFVVLLAVIKLIDYALSLSGIAAIILSIGMAVDANVLIFERMNEEIKE